LLLEGRPHYQSDHDQVQEKHGCLADTVSFVAFLLREENSRDQRCFHDELQDEVEICREGRSCTEKTPFWEEKGHKDQLLQRVSDSQ
jgi:hypothetical protein